MFCGANQVSGIDYLTVECAEVDRAVIIVCGDNEDEVEVARNFHGSATGELGELAGDPDDGNIRIVVVDSGAKFFESLDETIRRRFTVVIDIGLICKPQKEDL